MDIGAFEMGTVYAMWRHGQDRQAAVMEEMQAQQAELDQHRCQNVAQAAPVEEEMDPATPVDMSHLGISSWDAFVGQESLKRTLMVYITRALETDEPLPHVLLATGAPGVGKTTIARLIAKEMGRDLYEIVPPFNVQTLASVMDEMMRNDVLFIDEIHLMSVGRSRSSEMLLKVLAEGYIPLPNGGRMDLPPITIIGATTEPDLLPEPVLDRFKIKPHFEPYSAAELCRIAVRMAYAVSEETGDMCDNDLLITMALACRGVPRVIDEMVMAADALFHVYGRAPSSDELLDFLQVTRDGLTRLHQQYLVNLYRHFGRRTPMGQMEYICGENAMADLLRETKPGINRLERYLQEAGLLERTQRGRKLTDLGLLRVKDLIA